MANITIHAANRYATDTTWLAEYYGAQTSTNFEVLDGSGVLREANLGTNFTYGYNGFFNGGTINTISEFSSDGTLTFSATDLAMDVYARNNSLTVGTSGYGYYQLMQEGNDKITGSSGDDLIYGSKGNDTIDGGSGVDLLTFNGFSQGVTVNLLAGSATTSYGTSSVVNVEDIEGSSYGDTLTGNALNNSFQGFGGNDTINGGSGTDTASYLDASYAVTVNLTTGSATGGSGSDALTSIERIIGSRFNDTLIGSSANEFFQGSFGNDSIDGGGGVDTVQYGNVGSGVVVNLTSGVTSGGAGTDTLIRIENVNGSIFADKLTGDSLTNILDGGAGNDTMIGGTGNDTYYVRQAADIVTEAASAGTDTVYSYLAAYSLVDTDGAGTYGGNVENARVMGTGAANLTGNSLNNVLYTGVGNNIINGGNGTDTVSYAYGAKAGVTASLAVTTSQATGGSGSDTLTLIENLTGSNYADKLTGSTGNNSLNGGSGNDTLDGGSGNDVVIGGLGKDSLVGGIGNDTFDFNALTEMGVASTTWDVISDFIRGQDRIDLSTLDANTATTANEAFTTVIGSATAFTTAGQLKVSGGVLYGNTDADSSAEFAIQLTGITTLATSDFVL